MDKTISEYFAHLGMKGGRATGPAKVRGDADYYSRIGRKAAEAKRAKREARTAKVKA